ncbi:hypothetical protein FRC11_008900 [Ceratobasidium sp. 423]|nr:hypothetical protein FRC11_008900 [Ceratobasidium sp. 423]
MSHIDETASDIDCEYPDDENLDAEWDPEPKLDEPPRDPKPEATTQHQEQYEAVSAVVKLMNEHGLRRPQAASKALDQWTWNHTVRLSRAELDRLAANEHADESYAEDPME